MNPIIDTIKKRVSLRAFDERKIEKEHKDELFKCAMRAPTAGNQMLYTMIDITDDTIKSDLAKLCDNQPFIKRAPMVVVFVADQQKWFDYYGLNDVKQFCENHDELCFEAPQESDLLLACEDACIAAQNMVIAAESLGIGSCYIGDILENHEHLCELLNLPDWTLPIAMLVLGYYKDHHKKIYTDRFGKEFIVHENSYKRLSEQQLKDMHEERAQGFNANNKYEAENYAQQFYARKSGAKFSKEMARSVRVAMKKWDGRKL